MTIQPLAVRSWNGTPISRRTTDGYVNATAMCKANGKRWADFRESASATAYTEALSRKTEIPVYDLILSKPGEGTWVHPDVATELARWISPDFSVFVNQWFREEYERRSEQAPAAPAPAPMLNPQETLDLIERSMGLLERLGVMDQRDQLQFGDMVRNVAARGAGGLLLAPAPEDEEMTLSDAWLEVTGSPLPRGDGPKMGRLVAALYRDEFDQTPPTRLQYVDGAPRQVKSYKRGWLIDAVRVIWQQISG